MELNIQAKPIPATLQYLDKFYYSSHSFDEVHISVANEKIIVSLSNSGEQTETQIAEGVLMQDEFNHVLKVIENIHSLKLSPILLPDNQDEAKLFEVNFSKTSVQPDCQKAEVCFILKYDSTKEITNLYRFIDNLLP